MNQSIVNEKEREKKEKKKSKRERERESKQTNKTPIAQTPSRVILKPMP